MHARTRSTTARFSAVYSWFFSFISGAIIQRFGAFRRFAPDADGCVSVADVNDVGSVATDAENNGPPEGEDDEDEGASSSRNDFCISLRAGDKKSNPLLPRPTVVLAP